MPSQLNREARQNLSRSWNGSLPKLEELFPPSRHSMNRSHLSKALKYCSTPSHLHQIHTHMIKTGVDLSPFPTSKLLAAAALLDLPYAVSIFHHIHSPNLFMHNALLRGHSVAPDPDAHQALSLFTSLKASSFSLDQFSFIAALKTCARALALDAGRRIHGSVLRHGFECFLNLRNALIHFYCACGWTRDAHKVFDEMPIARDSVSWSALMGGYLNLSQHSGVLGLFRELRSCGVKINSAAVVTVLSASLDVFRGLESIHGYCFKSGFWIDLNVATAIMTMYVKSRCLDFGRKVFEEMPRRDVVSYNSLVEGYAKSGDIDECLTLLDQMESEGMKPNSTTLIAVLSACASSGNLHIGRCIHEYVEEEVGVFDVNLATALVNMYSKCGCLEEAIKVFNRVADIDVKLWTAMIMGLGVNGKGDEAIHLFCRMEEEGLRPNEVTFLAVLSACSHSGLLEEGKQLFKRMVCECGLRPNIEHYGCVIDLLGRVGLLEEAHGLIKALPCCGDATAWRALLSACRIYGNAKLGEVAQQFLVELGDVQPTDSILLSNIYALEQRWMEVARLRNSGADKIVCKKEAGYSLIEVCAQE